MIDPISATSLVITALGVAHQILKSPDVPKKDKEKIVKEAAKLVEVAQMSDIDRIAREAQSKGKTIPYLTGQAGPKKKAFAGGPTVARRRGVTKKRTPARRASRKARS